MSEKKNVVRPLHDKKMKAVAAGCFAAIAAGLVLLCAVASAMSAGKVPIWAVHGVGLFTGCVMAAVAGFVCARVCGKNGFVLGLVCAAVLFAAGFLCSICVGEHPGFWMLVKLLSMLICGCISGSIGVNTKK